MAAKNMLNTLRGKGLGSFIANLELLSDAYITLAYYDVSSYKKETKPINIPSNQRLLKIKNLENVAVPTLELLVFKNFIYCGFHPANN